MGVAVSAKTAAITPPSSAIASTRYFWCQTIQNHDTTSISFSLSINAGGFYASPGRRANAALGTIVRAIPIDESLHALFNGGAGTVAHIAHERLHIGNRIRNVPGLQRQQILLRLAAQAFLENL